MTFLCHVRLRLPCHLSSIVINGCRWEVKRRACLPREPILVVITKGINSDRFLLSELCALRMLPMFGICRAVVTDDIQDEVLGLLLMLALSTHDVWGADRLADAKCLLRVFGHNIVGAHHHRI